MTTYTFILRIIVMSAFTFQGMQFQVFAETGRYPYFGFGLLFGLCAAVCAGLLEQEIREGRG